MSALTVGDLVVDGPVRATWLMTHLSPPRVTHPLLWRVVEPDGYTRFYDTRRQALAYARAATRHQR